MNIVYIHISPENKRYVGCTKYTTEQRWNHKVKELQDCDTPLAKAMEEFGTDYNDWEHDVLFETEDRLEAEDAESVYISILGQYNVAKGGKGGDTGRNGEQWKINKQSKSLSLHIKGLTDQEKNERIRKSVESRRKNGTLGFKVYHTGEDHGNWSGYWVINGIRYATIKEAAKTLKVNGSSILDVCIRKTDQVWKRNGKFVRKGMTPRECGCYKEEV